MLSERKIAWARTTPIAWQVPGGNQQVLAETAPTGVLVDADADFCGEVASLHEYRPMGHALPVAIAVPSADPGTN